jgi:hypothetical protein
LSGGEPNWEHHHHQVDGVCGENLKERWLPGCNPYCIPMEQHL